MKKIFVFGSNLAGVHGAGSAYAAYKEHGAVWGCGIGLQGNSYAIPTKDEFIKSLSLERINIHVGNFLMFTEKNPEMQFDIVAIGCGLAGFVVREIAPMFRECLSNCNLPKEFIQFLENKG